MIAHLQNITVINGNAPFLITTAALFALLTGGLGLYALVVRLSDCIQALEQDPDEA